MVDADVQAQHDYYSRTAQHYDAMHISPTDEHGMSLSMFAGLARELGAISVLDVGAGTGRGVEFLRRHLPDARIIGIEPVEALRKVGHARGIAVDMLIEGDALHLNFADDSFDFVIETGALHHIATPNLAVAEMMRVARVGVMISDCNNFGQGSLLARTVKMLLDKLGLWNAYIWLTTKGKMAKWSEGDGVFFSYSVFDNIAQLRTKFPRIVMANTQNSASFNLKRGSLNICLICLRT